jgi:hypothetical protein
MAEGIDDSRAILIAEMNKLNRALIDEANFDLNQKRAGGSPYGGYDSDGGATGAAGIVNNFHMHGLVVREEADIGKIADTLYRKQQQNRRGLGVAF